MSNSRLEKFIYAICSMDVSDLPAPLSRIEKLWNCLITGETPDFEPLSRNEKYLMAMLGLYELDQLPTPMSRGEKLLYKIVMGETDLSDVPGYLSRYEELLKYLIENGGIIGGDFEYVLHTLNQSLSTLYSTAEKPVKSAILKGVTKYKNIDGQFYEDFNIFASCKKLINQNLSSDGELVQSSIRSVVDYIAINDVSVVKINGLTIKNLTFYDESKNKITTISVNTSLEYTLDIPEGAKYFRFSYDSTLSLESASITLTTVELASVKMPVLTTSNLGNLITMDDLEQGTLNGSTGVEVSSDKTRSKFIEVEPGEYTLAHEYGSWVWTKIYEYDDNKTFITSNGLRHFSYTGELNKKTKYVRVVVEAPFSSVNTLNISLCPLTSKRKEPYKSNILTTPEDLELRGIGNVKDELNLMTGEISNNFNKITIDGTENWQKTSNETELTVRYRCNNIGVSILKDNICICDSYNVGNNTVGDILAVSFSGTILTYRVLKSQFPTLEVFKKWLNDNPHTFIYQTEKSIKTVDLTTVDQDGQPTKLKTFNDITHVEINADNIIPSVDVEVATKISETLATLDPQQNDISETQNKLGQTIDEQTENTDATMMATTEIYEQTL